MGAAADAAVRPAPRGGADESSLLERFTAVLGERARSAGGADAVGGVSARFVVAPADTAEVSAVQRIAAEHGLAVVVRGSATKLSWGSPPERLDIILDTGRMNNVVEHAAGDLVVHVQAGIALDVLQAQLLQAGQRLALDPVVGPGAAGSGAAGSGAAGSGAAGSGTIGGVVATASGGPLRLSHGAVRDLLIGVTIVRADGTVAKSGGKVVKNVAGYDLGKLITGSWGTLGIITEAVFRLHPAPEVVRWVHVSVPDPSAANATTQALIHSHLVPTAVELDRPAFPGANDATGTGTGTGPGLSVAVLVEGSAAGVDARAAGVRALLGPDAFVSPSAPEWWGRAPWTAGGTGLRLTHEIAGLGALLAAVQRTGVPVTVRGSGALGVLHAGLAPAADPAVVARVVEDLRGASAQWGGDVVVLDAPPAVRALVDGWGPVRGLALMERIKGLFDPERLLAPGRFVGGL